MTTDLIYIINYKPFNHDYYQLVERSGKSIYYYKNDIKKCKLISSKGEDLIQVGCKGIYKLVISLNCLKTTKITDIKITLNYFGNYQIMGSYLNNAIKINWKWKRLNISPNSMILIDKNCNNRLVARIDGFTLGESDTGYLTINSSVIEDFHQIILISACLIWKSKGDYKWL